MNFAWLQEVKQEWSNKTVPWPNPKTQYTGQCVQFIRWSLDKYFKLPQWPGVIGAADFWSAYEISKVMQEHWIKIPNTPTLIPQEGDIFIQDKTKGGGYGHIGILIGDDQTVNYWTSIEQNYKPLRVSVVQHFYNGCLGFFRLKE